MMPISPGDVIADGAFRVVQVLQGGFSEVLIVEDWASDEPGIGRKLAVKRIREDRWNSVHNKAAVVKQLQKEALVWQTKLHKNPYTAELLMTFPDFYGLGPVLFMEVIEGPALYALRKNSGRLSVNETALLAAHIAQAMKQAHAAGVQHRDLTPSNVLLTRTNEARLIDWGLSAVMGAAGEEAFTPGYASPQREADPSLSDPRDDVFAFGVLLYGCLTEKMPRRLNWSDGEIELGLRQVPTAIPDEMVETVVRCQRRDPTERPSFEDLSTTFSDPAFGKEIRKWEPENAFCRQCAFIAGASAERCPVCKQPMWHRVPRPPRAGMIRIPAGRYTKGVSQQQVSVALQASGAANVPQRQIDGIVGPGHRAIFLPGFDIAAYPVTNAEFLKFCEDVKYPAHESLSFRAQTRPDHPVVHVDWKDALCYALWAGYRLPSLEEWEKAARGHKDARAYPWGDVWQHGICNNSSEMFATQTTPVSRYTSGGLDARSPYGVADMVGNVDEWVSEGRKLGMKACCGGSWATPCIVEGLIGFHTNADVKYESEATGFRCAADILYDESPVMGGLKSGGSQG